jgi:hypothetical protein
MLTETEVGGVWGRMLEAEVRSRYFGELASRYALRKQMITGLTFFFASGAAATLVAQLPYWFPLVQSVIVAVITAYSIAVNLDTRINTLSKLHYKWNYLHAEYERLWHHWYEEDAAAIFEELLRQAREASETATTEAPYDKELADKLADDVYAQYRQTAA